MRSIRALAAIATLAASASCAREAPGASKRDEPKPRENRLAKETSPYLLLHATNPVDWYPWGPEAFEKAKREEKPIFLSVGYSSCHWCHVMEKESFADEGIAKVLNERFVCIKVDREERPDVDQVYMSALQILTRGGGWPMTMFLTPDGRPFFGVTYLPPRDRDGGEGLATLLDRVAVAWRDERKAILADADRLSEAVKKASSGRFEGRESKPTKETIDEGLAAFAESFDPEFGGFNFDPNRPNRAKFPSPTDFLFLLDRARRNPASKPEPLPMVLKTLDRIARGGIRDQVAGGYHRYSTDRSWTVPHFEKMLYDNAQMVSALVMAFEVTGDPRWKAEAEATLGFVSKSLTAPDGTFYSALDADSPSGEGAFYVWTRAQMKERLSPDDFAIASIAFGLDGPPNFDGERYVLIRPRSPKDEAEALKLAPEAVESRLATIRAALDEARARRPRLARDEKVLTSWNGLMIAAYADAARAFQSPDFRRAGDRAADAILARHRAADGRLLRTSKGDAPAKLDAFLEDYASMAHGLLRLHAATGDKARLDQAKGLIDRMIADFSDPLGGFFFTAKDRETLFARIKDPFDGAQPGPNGLAVLDLLDLADATGDASYRALARKSLDAFGPALAARPDGAPTLLVGLARLLDDAPATPPFASKPWPADPLGLGVTASLVTGKAKLAGEKPIRPGDTIDAVVTLTIPTGWHIYANSSGSELFKPTTLALVPGSSATLESVSYPEGVPRLLSSSGKTLPLYEGSVSIPCRIKLDASAAPGSRTISILVRYQTCSEKACLAPMTLSVPLDLP